MTLPTIRPSDLGMITLNKVSQTEKNKYHVTSFIVASNFLKMIRINLFTKEKQTHRYQKQTYGYQRGNVVGRNNSRVWISIHSQLYIGFPSGSAVKNVPTMQETKEMHSVPGLGRSPGGGNGNPLQYFCLENLMDRGAWRATVSP